MLVIHCTKKLLAELPHPPQQMQELVNERLGSWYANLFYFHRKKHLAFINSKTLVAFVLGPVSKKEMVDFRDLFFEGLAETLQSLHIDERIIFKVMSDYREMVITVTGSRSLLGSLNDTIQNFKYSFSIEQYLRDHTIWDFNRFVNQQPMKSLGWKFPEAKLKELLRSEYR